MEGLPIVSAVIPCLDRTHSLVPTIESVLRQDYPNMEWNRWFAQLPSWGDYGTQKLFVFRKI